MSLYLVTGGSGFIGSHLVDALIARGDSVVVVDIAPPHLEWGNGQATYIQRDIRDEHLADVFIEYKPEFVVHLAAHIDDRASVREPVENAEHNILGTINVLDASRVAGVKRVVFASTSVVYGNQEKLPIEETAIPRPLTPYAVGKITGERYMKYFSLQLGLSTCALRLGNVYGPRQDGSKECGAVAIFTRKLLAGEAPTLFGDGLTTRDYIHVDDVVSALLLTLKSTEEEAMNIGTGTETSTRDLFVLVAHAAQSTVSPTIQPEVHDLVRRNALSPARAREKLGWSPKVSLHEGIAQTIAWYKEHR